VVRSRPAADRVIRCIVQVLGDASLTHQQRVDRVAQEGGLSLAGSRQQRRAVKVSELNNPRDVVARWYAMLDVWRTGVWVIDWTIPSLLNTADFGLPVELLEFDTHRAWRMTYHLLLPDGGWATEDEFDAAEKLRDERAERTAPAGGNAPSLVRKPFTGLPDWVDGEWQYALHSRREGLYELRRRPVSESTRRVFVDGRWRTVSRGWGRSPDKAGTVVGVIHALSLHKTVTSGLVEAAQRGLPVNSGALALVESTTQLTDDLRDELARIERRARNARRSALDATTEGARRDFQQEHETALADKARLEEDLVRLIAGGGEQILSRQRRHGGPRARQGGVRTGPCPGGRGERPPNGDERVPARADQRDAGSLVGEPATALRRRDPHHRTGARDHRPRDRPHAGCPPYRLPRSASWNSRGALHA
jgi:hypothetical protein